MDDLLLQRLAVDSDYALVSGEKESFLEEKTLVDVMTNFEVLAGGDLLLGEV